jgi:hypothetical protein
MLGDACSGAFCDEDRRPNGNRMRHNAVMGVVAVACAAVVSAPLLVGHNGGHHRGEKYAKRHQNLAGVFAGDGDEAAPPIIALALADLKTGDLAVPTGPAEEEEDNDFSPFIGLLPPLMGAGYAAGLQQAPPSPPQTPDPPHWPQPMRLAMSGLGGGAAAPVVPPVTPDPTDPPVTQDPPPVIPDPPLPPPVPPVVVVEVVTTPPPPGPPQPDPPVVPRIVTQNLVTPPAAVPEPSAWVMMILGLGAIGAVARRRRRDTEQRVSAISV